MALFLSQLFHRLAPLQPLCLATTNVLTLVLACVSRDVSAHVWIIVHIIADTQPKGRATLAAIHAMVDAKTLKKVKFKTASNRRMTQ